MKRKEQMMNAAEAYAAGAYADEPVSFSTEESLCETINNFCAGWRNADRCSKWIPVEEGLPKEKGVYLFHFDDGQTRVECYFPELHLSKCVTHWMPLPEAPRKEDKE